MILDNPNRSIEFLLSGVVETNQLMAVVSFVVMDSDTTTAQAGTASSDGITAVTLVPAPAVDQVTKITTISIFNSDTDIAQVIVQYNDNTALNRIVSVPLEEGEMLFWSDVTGWYVMKTDGAVKSGLMGPVGATGEQGIQGVQGEQGTQGVQGDQGIQGVQGDQGIQGDTGATGPSGAIAHAGMNEQIGTTYTLELTDPGKDVRCTNGSAIAVTIPDNATTAIPINSLIMISQGGAGAVTISGAGGVTVVAAHGSATTALGDFRVLEKTGTNEWRIC